MVFLRVAFLHRFYCIDIESVTDIMSCVKIDKSLVNYMVALCNDDHNNLKKQQHHFKVECYI